MEELPHDLVKKAYKNYADSHTSKPMKSSNWLDNIPSVTPMEHGITSFTKVCNENKRFYMHWLNYKS